jgi:hypothetical protein
LPIGHSTGLKVVNPVSLSEGCGLFTLGKEFLSVKKRRKEGRWNQRLAERAELTLPAFASSGFQSC